MLWCQLIHASKRRQNIASGNGLLPNGTKPLDEPILTCCNAQFVGQENATEAMVHFVHA